MKNCLMSSLPVVLMAVGIVQAQQDQTLSSVKQKYLSQRVVITGYVTPALRGGGQNILMEWHPAKEHGNGYQYSILENLPASYKGQIATVVSITLNNKMGAEPSQKVNALGESVSPDQAVNPYFDLVVKFDDGKMALTTAYPNTILLQLQLAAAHDSIVDEMNRNLPALVGKNLFAAGYSRLYQPDSTLAEMRGSSRVLKQLSMTSVPLLEPLQLTAAKYIDRESVVILKVRLPNGSEALSIAIGEVITNLKGTFLDKIAGAGGLLSELPTGLSAEELKAVKQRSLIRGMSKTALHLALGFPEKENDWGKGGKQLIYSDSILVYLDNGDKVVDWQILGN
jgi:hypothetical protein